MNQHDTKRWQEWAEKTAAAMSRCAASRGRRGNTVTVCQVGPEDQPLRCPACGGSDVQVAAILFTLPEGRLAYADGDGLHVFQAVPVDSFPNGLTLIFRCEDGHMFFYHWQQDGMGTRVTGLAVNVSQEALADERPLWWTPPAQAKGDRQ